MSIKPDNSHLLDRFLHIVGVDKRRPSSEALSELVAAFLIRVPFENISKLYYKKQHNLRYLPDLEMYINGIERYNFGGTCYSNNYYLHLLLKYLGYNVMLCGADMSEPDVHLVNIVCVGGREFLVDTGYAAPFLNPLPLDIKQDYVITSGCDKYILKPKDKNGYSHLELYKNDQLNHGYMVKPISRKIEYFKKVIEESYYDTSTFMNDLLMLRMFQGRSIRIHNLSVTITEGADYDSYQLKSRNELPIVVEEHFSIPQEIVSEAVAELGEFSDA